MSVQFKVNIKNLGKLREAQIRFGQFTVFAGQNSTGKSLVSKLLYSVLDLENTNSLMNAFGPHLRNFEIALRYLRGAKSENLQTDTVTAIRDLRKAIESASDQSGDNESKSFVIHECIDRLEKVYPKDPGYVESFGFRHEFAEDRFYELTRDSLNELLRFKGSSIRDMMEFGITRQLRNNLCGNFQINELSDLSSKDVADSAEFGIEGMDYFKIDGKDISRMQKKTDAQVRENFSRIIYVESPMLWRLKEALTDYNRVVLSREQRWWSSPKEKYTEVPQHFEDLCSMLHRPLREESPIIASVAERLTGDQVINGKIIMSEDGVLLFQENGKIHPLFMTAMGIVNLGMIAYLAENRIIDENSCLFIDEPEVRLHPSWQVEMIEALFAIARAGVNVVIATHSSDIIKWISVHIESIPEDRDLVEVNHFSDHSVKDDNQSLEQRLHDVLEDLTEPYFQMYYKGMR